MDKKVLEKKLKKIEAIPLGDDDIKKILPHVPIIKYSEFNKYNSIDDCLPNENSMLVYLIESIEDINYLAPLRMNQQSLNTIKENFINGGYKALTIYTNNQYVYCCYISTYNPKEITNDEILAVDLTNIWI